LSGDVTVTKLGFPKLGVLYPSSATKCLMTSYTVTCMGAKLTTVKEVCY